jgi:Ca2+-binding EF-hand superfamily protein
MNKRTISILTTSVALSITALAFAQKGPKFFAEADSNGDGKVTQAEAQALGETRFAATDTDNDGYLTQEEIRESFKAHRGDRAAHAQEKFAKKDKNSDGKLTADEVPRMPAEVFKKIDANGDGGLTPTELQEAWKARHEAKSQGKDGNKGGERRGPMAHLDTDGDGKVSKAEATALGQKMFQRVDANSDGVITKEELKAARPKHGEHSRHQGRHAGTSSR